MFALSKCRFWIYLIFHCTQWFYTKQDLCYTRPLSRTRRIELIGLINLHVMHVLKYNNLELYDYSFQSQSPPLLAQKLKKVQQRCVGHKRVIVILGLNSRFLQRPQKRSPKNQLIYMRLSKQNRQACSGSDPESQTGMYLTRWLVYF